MNEIDNSTNQRKKLLYYIQEILNSLSIDNLIKDKIKHEKNNILLEDKKYKLLDDIYVFGFGKSSASMGFEIEKIFGDKIVDGMIITKDGYERNLKKIEVIKGSHPFPDERTFKNTEKFLNKIKTITKNSTVFFLISGGGSALFEKPVMDLEIKELQKINRVLLESGLNIKKINIIRKHISSVKGGKLLKHLKDKNCQIFNFIISDVENNDLSTIASGPTYYDTSTLEEVLKIIKDLNLEENLPKKLIDFIDKNLGNGTKETLKKEEYKKFNVINFFISKVEEAVINAYNILSDKEKNVQILSSDLYGDSFQAGNFIGSIAMEIKRYNRPFKKPCILITGGETTVTIQNKEGIGGPNKEFILGFLDRIKKEKEITQIAIDTDGTDGPCPSAGAIGDYITYEKIQKYYDYEEVLKSNNTEKIFSKTKDLIVTGPRESNLNDLRITIIE
ncbi:MAG: glycerate kinase type-2 family protein [Thermotogota bacterium]